MKKIITLMFAFSITLMISAVSVKQESNPRSVPEDHISVQVHKPHSKNKKLKKSKKSQKQTRLHPLEKRNQPQRKK